MDFSQQWSLADIRSDFRKRYPYLKLEFYNQPHLPGEGSGFRDHLDPESSIINTASLKGDQPVSLDAGQTVAGFESAFFQKTGIAVQVLRLSGSVWIQTTETDDWTLQQQNKKGYEDSMPITADEAEDYGLQEHE